MAGKAKELEEQPDAATGPATGEELVQQAVRDAIQAKGGMPGKTVPGQRKADPELSEQRRTQAQPGTRKRKPKDPMAEGIDLAKSIVEEEMRLRTLRVEAARRGIDPNKLEIPIQSVRRRVQRSDATEMLDSKGNRLEFPGMVTRWVRTLDNQGRPSAARVDDFKSYGYECALDPHTGEPVKHWDHVLMIGSPGSYAERTLDRMPQDALVPDQSVNKMMEMAEMVNRSYGQRVGSVIRERTHGSEARMEPIYQGSGSGDRDDAEVLTG